MLLVYTSYIAPTRAAQDRARVLRNVLEILRHERIEYDLYDVATDEEAKAAWLRAVRASPTRELPCIVARGDSKVYYMAELEQARDEGTLLQLLSTDKTPSLAAQNGQPSAASKEFASSPKDSIAAPEKRPAPEPYRPSLDLDGISISSSQANELLGTDEILDGYFDERPATPVQPTAATEPETPKPMATISARDFASEAPKPAPAVFHVQQQLNTPPATCAPETKHISVPDAMPTPPMTPSTSSPTMTSSAPLTPHMSQHGGFEPALAASTANAVGRFDFLQFDEPVRVQSMLKPTPMATPGSERDVDMRDFLQRSPITPSTMAHRESYFAPQEPEMTDLSGLMITRSEKAEVKTEKPPIEVPPTSPQLPVQPRSPVKQALPDPTPASTPRVATPAKRSGGFLSCCSGASYYD